MSRFITIVRAALCAAGFLVDETAAAGLPSCESDTNRYCLDDDADLSTEGIDACLESHAADLDVDCRAYRAISAACSAELGAGGVCPDPSDAMPCLLQRVKPELRSVRCQTAIDASVGTSDKSSSLHATFWADGKRKLSDSEVSKLNEDDATVYRNWWKRKQKKSGSDSDVQYAIKKQKADKQAQILKLQAQQAAQHALAGGSSGKEATKAALKAIRAKLVAEGEHFADFDKDTAKDLAKAATKLAQDALKSASNREL
jgi:hypothetical protein